MFQYCTFSECRGTETEYREFADQPAIVVTRYDRLTTPDGTVRRIHQEDLVQTFGLDPSKKYEADGGPGVARIAARLRSATDDDSLDRFVRAVIGNYVLGAPDAHAKNYSLLLVGPTARMAPLYDVATGLIADSAGRLPWTRTAMSIGGERRFGEVEAKHWERLARAVGLDPEQVRRAVRQLAASIPEGFADAVAELPPRAVGATMLREDVLPRIAALAKRTLTGLDCSAREAGRVTRPFVSELETQGSTGPERRWDSR
ncbi:hypothetical protein Slu03_02260 [Sediminihabitans luteus]|nr:HipA domain-containing protein [Sediminihabitans luteus]GII97848.1 hypothetical protein Slu03_02260 [Sediminihabitans luteus]